ncbi:hypothetical protein Q5P01_015533 [Channa striata]|uniref:UPAR/Ly6 domain-containing protein n=1 Tax=Channa striata TaxID=64152 RepID=A0AA88MBL2_CHASR|nr:hypothetical protein Q5P01_015533 [Channa striata]
MKLILCLTLICGIFSTAGALRCQTCTDSQCSSITDTKVTSFESAVQQIYKVCASSSLCSATGNQTYSLSWSDKNVTSSVQCCNQDNCNTETPQLLNVQPNGLVCYSCNTPSSSCSTQLRCRGLENRCFKVNVTAGLSSFVVSGCASANLCSTASNNIVRETGFNFTCCGTNLCGGLQCQTCTKDECLNRKDPVDCSSETIVSGSTVQQINKMCAPSSLCPATGSQSYSVSWSDYSAALSIQCCDENNCNTETPQFPTVHLNSLMCYACNTTNSSCSTQLQCKGEEDRCFKANAGALQCQTCLDAQCSNTTVRNCSSETMCAAAAVQGKALGFKIQQIYKECAPSSLCPTTGNQSKSYQWRDYSTAESVQCCNQNNCNTETPQFLNVQPNGLVCYSCNTTSSSCSTQLPCRGIEDRCFKVNVTAGLSTSVISGCMSANLCSTASNNTRIETGLNFTCCETNLCNSASTTTTTSMCLLLGLLVFSFY